MARPTTSSSKSDSSEGGILENVFVGVVRGITGMMFDKMSFHPVSYIKQHAKPGDLLEFHRGFFHHYALYLGQGKVMNIDAEDKNTINAFICERTLEDVCGNSKVRIRNHDDVARNHFQCSPKSVYEIIRSAKAYENAIVPYEFDFRNCEYYSTLWRYGKGFSTQVAKPTVTPAGSVLGEVMTSSETTKAFLGATESFREIGLYAKYKRLVPAKK